MGTGALSPRLKWLVCEVDYSSAYNVEVKNLRHCIVSLPCLPGSMLDYVQGQLSLPLPSGCRSALGCVNNERDDVENSSRLLVQ
jgi:hypothetical protein